jgi:sugar phosphate isomerase/epimerase
MQLCLFSVSYAGLWGQTQLGVEAFIAKAASLGFGSVMLMGKRPHLSVLDATPERLGQIKQALRKHGVTCPVLGAYTDFSAPRAGEVPSAEMQVSYVQELSRIAAELDDKATVRIFTAYEPAPASGTFDRVVGYVRECCDRAAGLGVTIAVQNHHDLGVHTDALLEFHASVGRDNCKLAFDAWSPAMRGEDLYEAARKAAKHVAITTNADYVRFPTYEYEPARVSYRETGTFLRAVPFGEGFIDYGTYWHGLRDGGFDGVMSYEMCSPLRGGGSEENLDRYARSFVDWMQKHVGGQGGKVAVKGRARAAQLR